AGAREALGGRGRDPEEADRGIPGELRLEAAVVGGRAGASRTLGPPYRGRAREGAAARGREQRPLDDLLDGIRRAAAHARAGVARRERVIDRRTERAAARARRDPAPGAAAHLVVSAALDPDLGPPRRAGPEPAAPRLPG